MTKEKKKKKGVGKGKNVERKRKWKKERKMDGNKREEIHKWTEINGKRHTNALSHRQRQKY